MKHPLSELTGENPESGGDFGGITELDVDAELQSMGFRPAAADTPLLCLRVGGLRRQQQLPAFKAVGFGQPVQSFQPHVPLPPGFQGLVVFVGEPGFLGKLLLGQAARDPQRLQSSQQSLRRVILHSAATIPPATLPKHLPVGSASARRQTPPIPIHKGPNRSAHPIRKYLTIFLYTLPSVV